jgi:carnitine O-acetyltransferase
MSTQVQLLAQAPSIAERLAAATPQEEPTFNRESSYKRVPMESKSDKVQGGITFAGQDDLPKLPIPELEQSLKKYLHVLKPLQTRREHIETSHAVHDFLDTDGPELQDKLKKYAQGKTSYIEQFCKKTLR